MTNIIRGTLLACGCAALGPPPGARTLSLQPRRHSPRPFSSGLIHMPAPMALMSGRIAPTLAGTDTAIITIDLASTPIRTFGLRYRGPGIGERADAALALGRI